MAPTLLWEMMRERVWSPSVEEKQIEWSKYETSNKNIILTGKIYMIGVQKETGDQLKWNSKKYVSIQLTKQLRLCLFPKYGLKDPDEWFAELVGKVVLVVNGKTILKHIDGILRKEKNNIYQFCSLMPYNVYKKKAAEKMN